MTPDHYRFLWPDVVSRLLEKTVGIDDDGTRDRIIDWADKKSREKRLSAESVDSSVLIGACPF